MRRHLLVTNDFPPKVGGIQNYLWELWRRLPSEATTVYCTPHRGSVQFDLQQNYRIERSPEPVLLPYPWLAGRIRRLAEQVEAELVILDPALPLGHIGPALGIPYGLVLHGAEVTVPARLPISKMLLRRTLEGASLIVSAGSYALAEAERCVGAPLPCVIVPPGVDPKRFVPADAHEKSSARAQFGLSDAALVIASVNRLVPRKGMDRLIRASSRLVTTFPELRLMIGGSGREADRLEKLGKELGAPVTMLGRIADEDVVRLYQAADVMAMICHDRWRGLEQEGFGIVFLEAAGCGIPQVAGRSGGAAEAVLHDKTGLIIENPDDDQAIEHGLYQLLQDPQLRRRLGIEARARVESEFDYNLLAARLQSAINKAELRVPTP